MKKTLLAMVVALSSASAAEALDARIVRQLNALTPEERREQRCDIEALSRIRKEGDFRPDKVIAYSFGATVETGNSIRAPGAVFRAGGDWYRFNYKCETGEEGLKIMSFDYTIGNKVARDLWEKHYLYE